MISISPKLQQRPIHNSLSAMGNLCSSSVLTRFHGKAEESHKSANSERNTSIVHNFIAGTVFVPRFESSSCKIPDSTLTSYPKRELLIYVIIVPERSSHFHSSR